MDEEELFEVERDDGGIADRRLGAQPVEEGTDGAGPPCGDMPRGARERLEGIGEREEDRGIVVESQLDATRCAGAEGFDALPLDEAALAENGDLVTQLVDLAERVAREEDGA